MRSKKRQKVDPPRETEKNRGHGPILRKLNPELWHFFGKKEIVSKSTPFFGKSAKAPDLTFLKSLPALGSSRFPGGGQVLMKFNAAPGPRECGKFDASEF